MPGDLDDRTDAVCGRTITVVSASGGPSRYCDTNCARPASIWAKYSVGNNSTHATTTSPPGAAARASATSNDTNVLPVPGPLEPPLLPTHVLANALQAALRNCTRTFRRTLRSLRGGATPRSSAGAPCCPTSPANSDGSPMRQSSAARSSAESLSQIVSIRSRRSSPTASPTSSRSTMARSSAK